MRGTFGGWVGGGGVGGWGEGWGGQWHQGVVVITTA